jgi:hypothetical protein
LRPLYYGWQGEPITQEEWSALFADERHVGDDDIAGVRVSTVWLGLDHSWGLSGPPLIFETMVFGGKFDEWAWRYSTEREAREGHARIVAAVRAGEPLDALRR